MNIHFGSDRQPGVRPALRGIIAGVALVVSMASVPIFAGTAEAATGTVITTANTPFGKALVVGSGPYAGFSLYFITSDHGKSFGCTSKPVSTPVGTLLCTGPSNDPNAEWPAITTNGAPIAGPGVSQQRLGTVRRAGVGDQITYAGHPLYLFDESPGQVTGEGWDEPSLPPWHGIWYLIAPSGRALPWAGTLTTTRIGGRKVLAAQMLTAIGWVDFPVYTYSKDAPRHSACQGSCAFAWPGMLTAGTPGLSGGLSPSKLGTLHTPNGTQVRYAGHPLYLFAFEGIAPTATGFAATGNGNGVHVDGGTFRLVTP
jgi:predicted lipoprotein with Yx(FWY)xxD motif